MANRRFIDFPIAASVGNNDIVLIWQDGVNKQTTKATLFAGSPNSLAGLTDVDISALTNGQILQYNSTTSKWENVDRTDIDLDQLGDVTIVSPTNGQVLVYNSSTSKWENSSAGFVPYTGAVTTVNLGAQSILAGSFVKAGGTSAQFLKADGSVDSTAYGTGSVTSVALTMPSAFSVANSPVTTAGTLAVTGAGTVAQYVRGDGSLADFPATTGGGASVSYYLNGSVSQGTIGGVAYREFNRMPVFGAGTDITTNSDGYIASFITDAGDPNKLLIPAGNWNLETYFSASSGGGSPTFYVELYKYDGTTFTLIASNSGSPELIAFGTNLNPYFSTLAVPQTTLALTDRLALRYYVNTSGRTITLHTENDHLCQVITTFTTGLTALNGLTTQVQFFAVGTSGTDFNIASATDTHTFNLPTASSTNRGALSSADWALFTQAYNDKINSASVTGTTTKTLTLTQQDGGTITASWTDLNTDAVLSVFGRTGAVVAANGDYTTAQVTESGNLYYTDGRARGALSFAAGSGAYNSSTGVITIPTNNNQITNGAGYITSAALSGYLPLTGGTLTGPLGVTGNLTLIAGGSGSSFDRQISLGSGTAYSYQAKANGDDFQLIEAGSHVFLAYTYGGSLGTGTIRLYNNTISTASFTGSSFIRSGGTSSQFLKADGSVDSTSYQTLITNPVTGTGTSGQIAYWNGTNSITSDSDLLFDGNNLTVGGNITLTNVANRYLRIGSSTAYFYDLQSVGDDFQIREAGTTPRLTFSFPTGNATFSSSVTATSIIRSGGTSAQFLKADGSVDSTSYVPVGRTITINGTTQDLSANRTFNLGTVTSVTASSPLASSGGTTPNITIQQASGSQNGFLSSTDWTTFNNKQNSLTNPVTGTGTTNLLARFTGSTTIASSNIQDDGTDVVIASKTSIVLSSQAIYLIPNVSGIVNRIETAGTLPLAIITSGSSITLAAGGSTPQFALTSVGNVGIGTTTPKTAASGSNKTLDVKGGIYFGSTGAESCCINNDDSFILNLDANNDGGTSNFFRIAKGTTGETGGTQLFRVSGAGVVTIPALGTGTVTSTAGVLSSVSDSSYKIDDGFIDSAIEKVLNLKPRYFYWNEKSGLPTDKRQLGFYAQEVNKALGEEAANTPQNNNTSWGISDRSMIAMLTKAIQELKQEIDTLKTIKK